MTEWKDTLWCKGCGVEIVGPPVSVGQQHYCCEDCARGLECSCRSWEEQEEGRTSKTPFDTGETGNLG
jgi:hypothetical protein